MTETIIVTMDGHRIAFTIPQPHIKVFQPRNLKFRFKDNMSIEMQSPNYLNYLPYPTDYQMVIMEPEIPMPMYSLETNNDFFSWKRKTLLGSVCRLFSTHQVGRMRP